MKRLYAPWTQARTWLESAHLVLNLPAGIAFFTAVVTLVSLSAGLLITLVGVPLLIATILAGRLIGTIQRARAQAFLGVRLTPFDRLASTGSLWKRAWAALTDGPGWRGLVFGVLALPWGIFTFTITVVVLSLAVGGVTSPIWGWFSPPNFGDNGGIEGGLRVLYQVGLVVVGLLFAAIAPWILRGLAAGDRFFIRTLLSKTREEELEHRVEELRESRAASVEGAAEELRRIERDLHDGAQQRLVALAMDLGLARERLIATPDASPQAVALVSRAHEEAKAAIGELRDLVRGIHPTVLTDRGLDAALSAVAARCTVPVDVVVDLDTRPPRHVEAAAYFFVAEALTNVSKHSQARRATVRVARRDDMLVVEVGDDGVGGATAHAHGGLRGLYDRIAAVDGKLRIASPPGGPTMLVAEVPCGS